MTRKEIDQRNAEFTVAALRELLAKNAQFVFCVGINEQNELIMCSNIHAPEIEVIRIVQLALDSLKYKKTGIILLQ